MNVLTVAVLASALLAGLALAQGQGVCESDLTTEAAGFQFTEGPMWHPDGYLIFSDIPADTIYALKDGQAEEFRRPSGNSNGLTFDDEGRLVACEHGNRRVSRTEADGSVVALATHYEGKRLNSPNDVVVKSDGSVYFTDPPYGVKPGDRELDFQGVYRIGTDGAPTLLLDDFVKPNGLTFSPDEKVLYVADTERQLVRAYDVQDDGTLAGGRDFAHTTAANRWGGPDGMKVDAEGNLYVTAPGGVWVFDPEGTHLETIATPETPSNCAFGGPDGRTLFITARESVYSVRTRSAGAVYLRRFEKGED